jgi:hypothetical protein
MTGWLFHHAKKEYKVVADKREVHVVLQVQVQALDLD